MGDIADDIIDGILDEETGEYIDDEISAQGGCGYPRRANVNLYAPRKRFVRKGTLVIHPADKTTDFLKDIYSDKKWTVVNENISTNKLRGLIKNHDRIVMLGHGSEKGLIGFGRFVIDSSWVYLLRQKSCVSIWCNADEFVKKYRLKGFYTGMIISEWDEANMYCVHATMEEITASNMLFANAIKNSIDNESMIDAVKNLYVGFTDIINFNKQNLYSKTL